MVRVYTGEYSKEDLNRFRERIIFDFTGRELPATKNELALIIFKQLHYRGEKYPTPKQVDFVWETIRKMGGMQSTFKMTQETRATKLKREATKRGVRHRAEKNITFRGKKYRKGQFLPYDYGRGLQ